MPSEREVTPIATIATIAAANAPTRSLLERRTPFTSCVGSCGEPVLCDDELFTQPTETKPLIESQSRCVADTGVDEHTAELTASHPLDGVRDEGAAHTRTLCCGLNRDALQVSIGTGRSGDGESDNRRTSDESAPAHYPCTKRRSG